MKNFRKECLGLPKKTFDYLIVMDVDRKTLGMYDWDCVDEASKLNDAGVTFKLKLSDVIQITSVPNTLSKLL